MANRQRVSNDAGHQGYDAQAEADAWNKRGNHYLSLEDHRAAISCFNRALEANPGCDNEDVYLSNRATAYFRIRDFEKAVEGFKRASELRPLYPGHLTCLGKVYLRWGGHEPEALEALHRSLQLERTVSASSLAAKAQAALSLTRVSRPTESSSKVDAKVISAAPTSPSRSPLRRIPVSRAAHDTNFRSDSEERDRPEHHDLDSSPSFDDEDVRATPGQPTRESPSSFRSRRGRNPTPDPDRDVTGGLNPLERYVEEFAEVRSGGNERPALGYIKDVPGDDPIAEVGYPTTARGPASGSGLRRRFGARTARRYLRSVSVIGASTSTSSNPYARMPVLPNKIGPSLQGGCRPDTAVRPPRPTKLPFSLRRQHSAPATGHASGDDGDGDIDDYPGRNGMGVRVTRGRFVMERVAGGDRDSGPSDDPRACDDHDGGGRLRRLHQTPVKRGSGAALREAMDNVEQRLRRGNEDNDPKTESDFAGARRALEAVARRSQETNGYHTGTGERAHREQGPYKAPESLQGRGRGKDSGERTGSRRNGRDHGGKRHVRHLSEGGKLSSTPDEDASPRHGDGARGRGMERGGKQTDLNKPAGDGLLGANTRSHDMNREPPSGVSHPQAGEELSPATGSKAVRRGRTMTPVRSNSRCSGFDNIMGSTRSLSRGCERARSLSRPRGDRMERPPGKAPEGSAFDSAEWIEEMENNSWRRSSSASRVREARTFTKGEAARDARSPIAKGGNTGKRNAAPETQGELPSWSLHSLVRTWNIFGVGIAPFSQHPTDTGGSDCTDQSAVGERDFADDSGSVVPQTTPITRGGTHNLRQVSNRHPGSGFRGEDETERGRGAQDGHAARYVSVQTVQSELHQYLGSGRDHRAPAVTPAADVGSRNVSARAATIDPATPGKADMVCSMCKMKQRAARYESSKTPRSTPDASVYQRGYGLLPSRLPENPSGRIESFRTPRIGRSIQEEGNLIPAVECFGPTTERANMAIAAPSANTWNSHMMTDRVNSCSTGSTSAGSTSARRERVPVTSNHFASSERYQGRWASASLASGSFASEMSDDSSRGRHERQQVASEATTTTPGVQAEALRSFVAEPQVSREDGAEELPPPMLFPLTRRGRSGHCSATPTVPKKGQSASYTRPAPEVRRDVGIARDGRQRLSRPVPSANARGFARCLSVDDAPLAVARASIPHRSWHRNMAGQVMENGPQARVNSRDARDNDVMMDVLGGGRGIVEGGRDRRHDLSRSEHGILVGHGYPVCNVNTIGETQAGRGGTIGRGQRHGKEGHVRHISAGIGGSSAADCAPNDRSLASDSYESAWSDATWSSRLRSLPTETTDPTVAHLGPTNATPTSILLPCGNLDYVAEPVSVGGEGHGSLMTFALEEMSGPESRTPSGFSTGVRRVLSPARTRSMCELGGRETSKSAMSWAPSFSPMERRRASARARDTHKQPNGRASSKSSLLSTRATRAFASALQLRRAKSCGEASHRSEAAMRDRPRDPESGSGVMLEERDIDDVHPEDGAWTVLQNTYWNVEARPYEVSLARGVSGQSISAVENGPRPHAAGKELYIHGEVGTGVPDVHGKEFSGRLCTSGNRTKNARRAPQSLVLGKLGRNDVTAREGPEVRRGSERQGEDEGQRKNRFRRMWLA